ncbi:MAG TPA: ribonuclease HI family protein [Patescibacteria group bacterium]|nr:ribonuclease HI family protein [Patescibacteria group bacterium]
MIEVFIDGGSRGNPGPAAIGVVARRADKRLFFVNRNIGRATNNVAEYSALIIALDEAEQHLEDIDEEVKLFMDSELVVKQMKGEYRVKNVDLKPLYARAITKFNSYHCISLSHVARAKNADADKLVNRALDAS